MKKHFLKAAFAVCIMACFSLAAIRVPAEESVSATASEASSVQSYIFTPNTLPVLCLNIDGGEEEARKHKANVSRRFSVSLNASAGYKPDA